MQTLRGRDTGMNTGSKIGRMIGKQIIRHTSKVAGIAILLEPLQVRKSRIREANVRSLPFGPSEISTI